MTRFSCIVLSTSTLAFFTTSWFSLFSDGVFLLFFCGRFAFHAANSSSRVKMFILWSNPFFLYDVSIATHVVQAIHIGTGLMGASVDSIDFFIHYLIPPPPLQNWNKGWFCGYSQQVLLLFSNWLHSSKWVNSPTLSSNGGNMTSSIEEVQGFECT